MIPAFSISDFAFSHPLSEGGVLVKGTFDFPENSSILIAGSSGSGKSTLLYALKGLIPHHLPGSLRGNVFYKGKNTRSSFSVTHDVGIVFQSPEAQMARDTVRNEIAFGLENLSLPRDEIIKRIARFSEIFHITDLLDHNVRTLSGGEKQKLALLSILAMDPQTILLDEPTGYLDSASAADFFEITNKYFHKKTIVTVEHNLRHMTSFCDRVLFLSNGGAQWKNIKDVNTSQNLPNYTFACGGKEILKAHKLSFSYGKRKLIENLSFSLKEGNAIGISGKNGCGKSTLLKILMKLLKVHSGEIHFYGKEIGKISSKQIFAETALLFQNPENHFTSLKVSREADEDYLEKFGLMKNKDKSPFMLSEGEKRRLSIAAASSLKRKIFLMDEPTFSLDAASRNELAKTIYSMKKNGTSFIIVSHDEPFLNSLCESRLKFLDGGFSFE